MLMGGEGQKEREWKMGWHYYAIRSWDIATGRSNLFSIAGKLKTLRYFIVLYIVRIAG